MDSLRLLEFLCSRLQVLVFALMDFLEVGDGSTQPLQVNSGITVLRLFWRLRLNGLDVNRLRLNSYLRSCWLCLHLERSVSDRVDLDRTPVPWNCTVPWLSFWMPHAASLAGEPKRGLFFCLGLDRIAGWLIMRNFKGSSTVFVRS